MNARDTYIRIFGGIESLAERVSWATGVSNMLEWLTWHTRNVLGVSKTQYWKQVVAWSHDAEVRGSTLEEKQRYIHRKLNAEMARSEQTETYAPPGPSFASPREALRRAKFFSEEYLNKEFDIFWSLVSDRFLDEFYGQDTALVGGGQWFTHGNSGLFANSADIGEMQMDNLSYNPDEGLLVANELKLGGRKNRDQILKYALMFRTLRDRGFVAPQTRFLLLFFGDSKKTYDWSEQIADEIEYCRRSTKSTAAAALNPDVIETAKAAEYVSTSWAELIVFNEGYLRSLDPETQQVERKLISGFDETLAAKKFLQSPGE